MWHHRGVSPRALPIVGLAGERPPFQALPSHTGSTQVWHLVKITRHKRVGKTAKRQSSQQSQTAVTWALRCRQESLNSED